MAEVQVKLDFRRNNFTEAVIRKLGIEIVEVYDSI